MKEGGEELAPPGPEAGPPGRLEQGRPQRLPERREDPRRRDSVGCADWSEVAGRQASKRLWRRGSARGGRRLRWEYVPDGLHGTIRESRLCPARLPEEIQACGGHAEERH